MMGKGVLARPRIVLAALFVAALIAMMPMRFALGLTGLGGAGLSARSSVGPVWFATLREVHFGDLDLGDMHAFLAPVSLLLGQARIDVAGPPPLTGPALRGGVTISGASFGVDDLTASVAAGRLFAPLPVTKVHLEDVSVAFTRGACSMADGRIKLALGGAVGGITLAQGLSGTARCEGAAMLIALASASGTERLRLTVNGDGRYRSELLVATSDPASIASLTASGFQSGSDGYRLSVEGRF